MRFLVRGIYAASENEGCGGLETGGMGIGVEGVEFFLGAFEEEGGRFHGKLLGKVVLPLLKTKGRMSSMKCECGHEPMAKVEIRGRRQKWRCGKCKKTRYTEATEEDYARAQARKEEERAPEGEDAELWHMKRVMMQEKKADRGLRQKFYREMMEADKFRFVKMMQEREAVLKKEQAAAGPEARDEGLERSLALAEQLLKDLTKEGE